MSAGAKGARLESRFAAMLKRAGWTVEGPKPRARFGRTDYYGLFDGLAERPGSPSLFWQVTAGRNASSRRKAIAASPVFGFYSRSAPRTIIVGEYGRRKRTGAGWRIDRFYGSIGWLTLGFVNEKNEVVESVKGRSMARFFGARKEAKP